ncbi:MAG: tRNA dihydrouridine synthase DusB [Myxococcota bacterium]
MAEARVGDRPCVEPLRVGPRVLESNLVLAPMAGVTNLPFRLIARRFGAALVFTETVSARGLVSRGAKSWRLVETAPAESPLAYQIFGSDAGALGLAAQMLADRGATWIDLNLGCPVRKFIRNGAGSALLRVPRAVAPLVRSMRRALPGGVLSVKVRTGWDSTSITAPEVARIAESEGADLISVHGRTRAQLYSGRADRRHIADVVSRVAIPVLANGDITRASDALDMLRETGAAGVMIGRGALANPWIFRQIHELAAGRPLPVPSGDERCRLIERHLTLLRGYCPDERRAVHVLKKYLSAWSTGLTGSSCFRSRIQRASDFEAVVRDAREFFREAA